MELTTLADRMLSSVEVDPPSAVPLAAEDEHHVGKDCRLVGDILSRVGDKWSMLVVMTLLNGPLRFNELKRSIKGISQQMLSRTVRALERDGLLIRTVLPSVPVSVEYQLSALGLSLSVPVQALGAWALNHREVIETSRAQFDQTYQEA